MLAADRLTDITIGIGSHGHECCPHVIIGIRISGSYNTDTNMGLDTSGINFSYGHHDCPHCPINLCITGSTLIYVNNEPKHRMTDVVTEFCGIGNSITGSNNCFCGG